MKLDGRNVRVNILVLSMQDEVEPTLTTLNALIRQAEEGVTISVLLNGGHSPQIDRLAKEHGCLRTYSVERNLGVAGGRNLLLGTAECRASDVVLVVDNDVIPPLDYVRGLVSFLLRHGQSGVVGAMVADVNAFGVPENGRSPGELRSAEIKEWLLRDLTRDRIYHMGVRKDYEYAYFSIVPVCLQVLGYLKVFAVLRLLGVHVDVNPILKGNAKYRKMVNDGVDRYEVSNVAGCSQAFRRTLVDEIGCLDGRFSPYGFEDAEFCIRAMRAGYTNYIDTNTWLLHGTDQRHAVRDPHALLVNIYRSHTLLGSSIYRDFETLRRVMLRRIVAVFLVDLLRSPFSAVKELRSRMEGLRKGLEALA